MSTLLALLLAAGVGRLPGADPDPSVRAVWITRFDYRSADDVRRAIADSARAGFNTVLFQVRGNASTFYPSELEPWAATWCLATEPERWAQRLRSSMAELQAFYDAFFPRAEQAIAYCDRFPLDDLPADAERLLQLLHSLLMVSYAVEVWRQPEVVNGGSARIDRILEPLP